MTQDIEQRTDVWFAARCGRVTASRIADLLARTKSGWGASRANYLAQLVCERLTGNVEQGFTNAAMLWGVEKEAEARDAYQIHALAEVKEVGFVVHPRIEMSGASPDGLVGDKGMVELKCPNSSTHIATLLGGGFADKYVKQALWQMACCERDWVDLVSYDPRLPETMRLFVRRIGRDHGAVAEIEREVTAFLAEVEETTQRLMSAYAPEAVAA